jgi:alkyl sulfatase BDS1-like metallo-beta-lactamase superfamily hydrolase
MTTAPKDAEPSTRAANAALRAVLPFEDRRDFEDTRRGLIATLPDGVARAASGQIVWNLSDYEFLAAEEAPATVNPSLWRMAQLNRVSGLFQVIDRIYQLRGLDLANMTIIEGDTGLIVIDTLLTCEAAKAGLDLYYAHRPCRPIVAVIYTHSHADHFGGVKGIISNEDVSAGRVTVIAPDGFMAAIGGENVLAGLPMVRRAQFQFGTMLPKGERQQVDVGLGKGQARGILSLPLRGSVARDPRMWSHYLSQAIELFGAKSEVLIGQHHWPTWGSDNIVAFLAKQRDLYKYIHDQSLRLMNKGWRPAEIAEAMDLPPDLAREWSVRGYYGTISHNAKAVYQRYLSWYDGNPANLNPLPPVRADTDPCRIWPRIASPSG